MRDHSHEHSISCGVSESEKVPSLLLLSFLSPKFPHTPFSFFKFNFSPEQQQPPVPPLTGRYWLGFIIIYFLTYFVFVFLKSGLFWTPSGGFPARFVQDIGCNWSDSTKFFSPFCLRNERTGGEEEPKLA